nr:flagellar hook-basal body complex protein FliE [candidate division Zixibacteria bacterium]
MSGNIGQVSRLVPGLQEQLNPGQVSNEQPDKGKFTELFNNLLDSVNELHLDAGKAQELLATGEAEDLHQVMIAIEEAGIATDLLLEIRNRLMDAYQEIMRMPM